VAFRRDRLRTRAFGAVSLTVGSFLLLVPGFAPGANLPIPCVARCGAAPSAPLTPLSTGGNVRFGAPLAVLPVSTFWAVEGHMPDYADRTLAAEMNATPVSYYRYAAGAEATNQTTGVMYTNSGQAERAVMDDATFVTWCRWVHCRADMEVPAEINRPGAAADTVRYVEDALGFHPAYWSIGNEPVGWRHYNIPWTSWRTSDDSRCDPSCFAQLVTRYVAAMRSVDPTIRIIGIQNSDCYDNPYLTDVAQVDGRLVNALACHSYPAANLVNPTVAQFFRSLTGPSSLPTLVPKARAAIRAGCSTCALPLFVDEYNGFIVQNMDPVMGTYAGAVYIAASIVQALELNLSQFEYFSLQDLGLMAPYSLIDSGDTPAPSYYDYSVFARHLFLPTVASATVSTSVGGIFAALTEQSTHRSFFLVNTNTSHGVSVGLAGSGFPLGGGGTDWSWNPALVAPKSATYAPGPLPSTYWVPPEGILLVDSA
jgi:hypothetical protein